MRDIGAALTAAASPPSGSPPRPSAPSPIHASGIVKAGDRAPHPPDGPPGTGPAVTFARSNLAVAWDDRYPSLLDLAEACDVPVGFGCRNGVCHNCESGAAVRRGRPTPPTRSKPPPGGPRPRLLLDAALASSRSTSKDE